MRRYIKNQIQEILNTMFEAHQNLYGLAKSQEGMEALQMLLEDCQNAAVSVGNMIEETEGEGTQAVKALEVYCELLYNIAQGDINSIDGLDKCLRECLNDIEFFQESREVVFLPYKASMWDSLESVWKRENEDPNCNAVVIPIPYYDKNPDGSFKMMHYEGNEYPSYVPVIKYDEYDFEGRHPDAIYIHNPYDNFNLVTSIHPYFYCENLKKFTDKLIYIPYFVLAEARPEDKDYLTSIEHFVNVPGVVLADEVIVQSPDMAKAYVNIIIESYRKAGNLKLAKRSIWEAKIKGTGSPKIEKIKNLSREDCIIPEEWNRLIVRPDGSRKKLILYNNSIGALLSARERMIQKIERVLEIFYKNREEVTLLWRPHPLIRSTLESMYPELWNDYSALVEKYISEGWGIYDDSADMDRALVISDAYFGDQSSLVQLFQVLEKPIMIQNVDI